MSDTGQPVPPISWLAHLMDARQWERLEDVARQRLAVLPHDPSAHFHRAWALLRLDRDAEMQPHVEHLLNEDPEDVRYLQLAALWHMADKRYREAQTHVETALSLSPEGPSLHHIASIIYVRRGEMGMARMHAARARSLSPDDADYVYWDVIVQSVGKDSAKDIWDTLKKLEDTLRLDPENSQVMTAIGDLWINSLEQPRRAEDMYRRALACDPGDKAVQRKLWQAIQKRNLFFRTLRLPIAGLNQLRHAVVGAFLDPWRIVLFFLTCKFLSLYLIWLVVAGIVLAPPAWLFEWLVLMDIRQADRVSQHVGLWWLRFHRLPFPVRFGLCLALVLAFWCGLFALLGISLKTGLIFVAAFFAVHLMCMLLYVFCRKWSAGRAADWNRRPAA